MARTRDRFVCEFVGGSLDGTKSRGVGSVGGMALPKLKIMGSISREHYERDDFSGAGGYWIYRFVGESREPESTLTPESEEGD